MAWNEPGGSKDNDPWGGGKKSDQGPPDLDEVVKKFQDQVRSIFGGKGKGSGGDGEGKGSSSGGSGSKIGLGVVVGGALFLWGLTGIYIVDEGKRGVELVFGAYSETTQPGPHWHMPAPISTVEIVDVSQIRNVEIGYRSGAGGESSKRSVLNEAMMLTQDENIVDVNFAVQYRIKDAQDYLFNLRSPDETLREATESAVREIVGKSKMDFVLTEGRSEMVQSAEILIQAILDRYGSGLQVTSVNMQDAQPPEQVQAAFSDAVKAREDEQRVKNEAEAYANDILPKARGAGARMFEEATAYKSKVVSEAEGQTSRFLQVLTEYEKAPVVTRERMYLDAMETVLNNTSKVMLDVEGSGNLLYLPLDRMMAPAAAVMPMIEQTSQAANAARQVVENRARDRMADQIRARSTLRSRETR
ncbi:HflK protein [hydrothermal vent metagenome]|uniref:HflK protein n=1 Tax=hydrothermal vent metagenome TaxID=652676 RepID=A0A3B0Z2B8_9ZZZZ